MSAQSEDIVKAQREVQRKLGRYVLRIQQLEVMARSMVAYSVIESGSGEMHSSLDKRKQVVAKKSLGQVVGDLTTDFYSLSVNEQDQQQEYARDPTKIRLRISSRIEMTPEEHQRTRQRLSELVEERNKLVHHFFEFHDIWTGAGCASAERYLDDCLRQIDEHFEDLSEDAKDQVEALNVFANAIRSGVFKGLLRQGTLPSGPGAIRSSCTIVSLLRDAEATLAVNGWTSLAKAIEYICGREPEHTPKRYGCSSWRQVLHESAMFTIRRGQFEPGMAKETWYRSRSV